MKKFIPLFLIAAMLSFEVKAQCDADFSLTVNQNRVSFSAAPAFSTAKHRWFFGDNSYAYFQTNPAHTYSQPGTYTVLHVVQDSVNSCVDSVFKTVILSFGDSCGVYYTHAQLPDSVGVFVFHPHITTVNSGGIDSILWTVNGVPFSTTEQTTHTFAPGAYNVCVFITTDSGCTAEYCDTILYQSDSTGTDTCHLNASFTYQATSSPLQINFTASPNQPGLIYSWNFGDSHNVSGRTPSHTYGQAGSYVVKLVVFDSLSHCRDTVWQYVNVSAPDTCTASFTYIVSGGQVSFTALSNGSIASQLWIITSLPDSSDYSVTLHSNNPSVNLPDSGFYYVCLAITTHSGCVKWYCDSILYTGGNSARIAVIPSYPNPVSAESSIRFNLSLDGAAVIKFKVSNLAGNVVYQAQRQGNQGVNMISIPVQQLGRGQYFIDIQYGNSKKRSVFQKL